MKATIQLFIVAMLAIPLSGWSQSPADALFDKYSGQEGFTSVYITQHMFGLFADIETKEDESGFFELVKNLDNIKILSMEHDSTGKVPHVNFYKEIMSDFPEDEYEELMVVKKKDQDIKFFIRKEGGKIAELLMVIGGVDDNALISIQGDIDLKTISKLSKTMELEGMENLEEIEDK